MPQGHFVEMVPGATGTNRPTRSLPIKSGQTAIKRGSVLVEDAGEWRLSTTSDNGGANSPGPVVYFALQDQDSPDVTMSGVLSAIPCTFSGVFQTDQFSGTLAVGTKLMAGNGVLIAHTDDKTVVAEVRKGNTIRWSNDRLASTAYGGAQRTGAHITVLDFQSLYLPNVSIS